MPKIKTAIGEVKNFKNFFTYFADHFGLIKNKYIIYRLRLGIKYKVRSNSSDRNIIDEVCTHRFYNPNGFEIKENDTVVDIGAHIGIFSIFAAKFAKNGRVFSFEPVPENFALLCDNIEINKIKNIIPIHQAVSDKNDQENIFLDEDNHGVHSFFNVNTQSQPKKILVEAVSLGSFIKDSNIAKIDFLKIDCEGAEYKILFNCSKEILDIIDKISMEYHDIDGKNNVNDLIIFLENNGFKVTIKSGIYPFLYAKK